MELEDWEYWIENIEQIDCLSSMEKQKSKSSLRAIKRFFRVDLPALVQSGHPIYMNYIINETPGTRKWFIDFAESIENALKQKNGRKMTDQLRNKEKFFSLLFELDIANRFIKTGFNVEFYPKMNNFDKIPDLKIINPDTNEEFFVEITEHVPSVQAKEISDTFQRISAILHANLKYEEKKLLCSAKVLKYISEPHMKEIISKIIKKIEKCKKTGFEELNDDGIKIAISHEDKRNYLIEWRNKHKVTAHLEGPPVLVDEIHRLSTKIMKKQKQLPKNYLNILVILDHTLFFEFGKNINEKISRLTEHIYKHDHLAFCVIVETYSMGMGEKIQNKEEHMYLHKSDGMWDRDILFLTNRFISDKSLTLDSISKIKKAFVEEKTFLV